jgi:hypothetical protein
MSIDSVNPRDSDSEIAMSLSGLTVSASPRDSDSEMVNDVGVTIDSVNPRFSDRLLTLLILDSLIG